MPPWCGGIKLTHLCGRSICFIHVCNNLKYWFCDTLILRKGHAKADVNVQKETSPRCMITLVQVVDNTCAGSFASVAVSTPSCQDGFISASRSAKLDKVIFLMPHSGEKKET